MKKIFLIILILILLAAAAVTVFFVTFDANRYRSFLVEKLEQAAGKPVSLEHVALRWDGGVVLQFADLKIYADESKNAVLLELSALKVLVEPLPLLNREIKINSIILEKPVVAIVQRPDGSVVARPSVPVAADEPSTATAPEAGSAPSPEAMLALSLLVRQAAIRDGVVILRDETQQPVREWRLEDIDVQLRDVALNRPVRVEVQGKLLSTSQNIQGTGTVEFSVQNQILQIRDVELRSDLKELSLQALEDAFPELASSGLQSVAGQFRIILAPQTWSVSRPFSPHLTVELREGEIAAQALREPVQAIALVADFQNENINLTGFSAQVAGGQLSASGNFPVAAFPSQAQGRFQLNLTEADLTRLIPVEDPDGPQWTGRLSASLKGAFTGRDWEQIRPTLIGEGQLSVQDGALLNLNIVRELLNRLTMIPGLSRKIEEGLPPDYHKKLEAPDTRFEPLNVPFVIRNGFLVVNQANIVSDQFQLNGTGQVSLTGQVLAQARVQLDAPLSAAMIRSVRELGYLADAEGRVAIPVMVQGALPYPAAGPDLQYIASRLAMSKASEWVSGILGQPAATTTNPPAQGQATAQTNPNPSGAQQQDPVFSLINQFLKAQQPAKQGSETSPGSGG